MSTDPFSFDTHGHLVPYERIDSNWQSVERVFGWTDHRRDLLTALHSFVSSLNQLSILTITLWLDGSFVTKKEHPNDLDVVLVIPSAVYRQFESHLRSLRTQFRQLDLYFVRLIEPDEPDYFLYLSDSTQWFFQFTTTKPSRLTRVKFPKGFVQLTWHDEPIVESTS